MERLRLDAPGRTGAGVFLSSRHMVKKTLGKKFMPKRPATNKKSSANERNYGDIFHEVKDQVAWVTINRPRVLNAFRE